MTQSAAKIAARLPNAEEITNEDPKEQHPVVFINLQYNVLSAEEGVKLGCGRRKRYRKPYRREHGTDFQRCEGERV
jgi:hypothetical protein